MYVLTSGGREGLMVDGGREFDAYTKRGKWRKQPEE